MERTKQEIIDEMEVINDEIEQIINDQYKNLALNSKYQKLTDRLRELLDELNKKGD